MPDIVRNVRGRGTNGWVRVVTCPAGRNILSDPILIWFMRGESMDGLGERYGLPTLTVEAVIRYYLNNPKVMRRVLGVSDG